MLLDIGCGCKKKEGYIGLDVQEIAGVDIVHNMEDTPWPIQEGICTNVNASHILEHIKPWKIIDVMNEIWRICAPKAELDVRTPYGDYYRFDPTHTIHWYAPMWLHFDPSSEYYDTYSPKPWKMMRAEDCTSVMELHVILRRLPVQEQLALDRSVTLSDKVFLKKDPKKEVKRLIAQIKDQDNPDLTCKTISDLVKYAGQII